jgi:indolepyruvate ferredoxin oxidoreductase
LALTNPARTDAILDAEVSPSAWFVGHQTENFEAEELQTSVRAACRQADALRPKQAARRLLGDAIYANVLMLGAAFQKGLVPVSAEAIEGAIALNGVAVDNNLTAFRAGRLLAHDGDALMPAEAPPAPDTIDDLTERRAQALTNYQNEAYAQKFVEAIGRVRAAERRIDPASEALTRAALSGFFKLMAYKDEYEVARAYTDPAFRAKLDAQLEGDFKLRVKLAPPIISRRDPVTGHLLKREFGPWIFPLFRLLGSMKWLRGTRFDPFGYSQERRKERSLIPHYGRLLDHVTASLTTANLEVGARIAGLPEMIKGFGHVKAAAIEKAMIEEQKLLKEFDTIVDPPVKNLRVYA